MNAIIARPATGARPCHAQALVAASRCAQEECSGAQPTGDWSLPAKLVEPIVEPSQLDCFMGLQRLWITNTLLYPEIGRGDVIEVNFERREIRYDGLYLVVVSYPHSPPWHGARKFQLKPTPCGTSALWVNDSNRGDWREVDEDLRARIKVLGEITEVLKPVNSTAWRYE